MPYNNPAFPNILIGANAVVNGSMLVSQPRSTIVKSQSLVAAAETWNNCDNCGVKSFGLNTAVVDDSQDVNSSGTPFNGFGYSKKIRVTTAEAAIGAAEGAAVFCSVEGVTLSLLFNQVCVLSFWVQSPKVGIHYVAVTNGLTGGAAFSQVLGYVVNQSNTWEQKVVGFVFNLALGTWDGSIGGLGLRIYFPLAAGANLITATPGSWQNVLNIAGAGQQNLLDTIGNVFRLTAVNLNIGFVALSYDQPPFDIELARCQRFYWQTNRYGQPPGTVSDQLGAQSYRATAAGVAAAMITIPHPVPMAVTPVVTTFNPNGGNALWRNESGAGADSGAATVLNGSDYLHTILDNAQVAGDAIGNFINIHATFDARI